MCLYKKSSEYTPNYMKRKVLLFMAFCLPLMAGATGTSKSSKSSGATTPEAINIVHHDLTITSTMLDEMTCLTFSSDETTVKLHTTTVEKEFIINDIRKVLFGEYIAPDTPTDVETIENIPTEGVYKTIENGHLVIIKDNVKYNIWGTAL